MKGHYATHICNQEWKHTYGWLYHPQKANIDDAIGNYG